MIRLEVDTREVDKMLVWLGTLKGQLNYASSRALNETAKQMATELNQSTTRYFDRPTKFTQSGYRVSKYSSKTDLVAELDLKPIQSRYLTPSIRGGVRPQRPSERRMGFAPAWRPGVDATLSKTTGNMSKAAVVTALKGGGKFFRIEQERGKLWPGVYQRMANGRVKNVLSFGRLPTIGQRWPVAQVAQHSLSRHWPVNLNRWLEQTTRGST